jgi:CBS domain-containing protein
MPDENPKPPTEKPAEAPPLKAVAEERAGALTPGDTVKTAGDKMRALDTEKWPVSEDCKLVGMVEEKHPDRKIAAFGHDPKSWRVHEIMNRNVIFCYEDEDCAHAGQVMDEHGLSYLPVVDRDMRIVGIFSRGEIAEKADGDGGKSISDQS